MNPQPNAPTPSTQGSNPFARPDIDNIYVPGIQWVQDSGGAIEPVVVQSGHFAAKAAKSIRDCNEYPVFKMNGEVKELLRIDGVLRARDVSGERMRVILDTGGANREFLSLPPGGGAPAWAAGVPVADVTPAGGAGQDLAPVGATVAATAAPAPGWSSTGPYATMLNAMMPLPAGMWFEKL